MRGYLITTGTITYALKGRDLLRKKGFKAHVEKITSGAGSNGCGYAVFVQGNIASAEEIMRQGGIKILEINARA